MPVCSDDFENNLSQNTFKNHNTSSDSKNSKHRSSNDNFDEYMSENNQHTMNTTAEKNKNSLSTFSGIIYNKRLTQKTASSTSTNKTDLEIPIENFYGSIRDFLSQNTVQLEIARRFKLFLRTFEVNDEKIYISHINDVARMGGKSILIDYIQFTTVNPTLGLWIADAPKPMLKILNRSARMILIELYPDNNNVTSEIHVRFHNVPISDTLRNIRNIHLNSLIRVFGVVTRCTGVFPQLLTAKLVCGNCGYETGPIQNYFEVDTKPIACPNCQKRCSFTLDNGKTTFRNYQRITLQEAPDSVNTGRLPRSKQVILLDDLIDSARPGEEIDVTGIYLNSYDIHLTIKNGFPIFNTVIEANCIQKKESYCMKHITDEDLTEIYKFSRIPNIIELFGSSIAPFIYGHIEVKDALVLAILGGQEKCNGTHRIRGDINVLLLGDPSTAKSQFLKCLENTLDKSVFTTGKGVSAAGLTASVIKDPISHEWTLEGGAMVLADRGICLIDEFDKMNDCERASIHEAMEQQSISISKAGIVTQLNARCSVVASANPLHGRYDPSKHLRDNVSFSDPILTRFDIICVIRDTFNPFLDEKLAEFVVDSHSSHTNGLTCSDLEVSQQKKIKNFCLMS